MSLPPVAGVCVAPGLIEKDILAEQGPNSVLVVDTFSDYEAAIRNPPESGSKVSAIYFPQFTDAFPGTDPRLYNLIDQLRGVSISSGVYLSKSVRDVTAMPLGIWRKGNKDFLWDSLVEREVERTDKVATVKWADDLSRIVREAIQQAGKRPKYVLYPMSGFDLVTAVKAFDADVYVLIDNHPFISFDIDDLRWSHGIDLGFVGYTEDVRLNTNDVTMYYTVDVLADNRDLLAASGVGGMAPLIFGNMKTLFPDFHVRTLQYFTEINSYLHGPTVHGVVGFDLGPGTPPKTLVFINAYVLKPFDHIKLEGGAEIGLDIIDAMIVRGAIGRLRADSSIGRYFERLLRNNGGVVLEGSFGIQGREFWGSSRYLPDDVKVSDHDMQLSYSKGTRIVSFPDTKNNIQVMPEQSVISGGLYVFRDTRLLAEDLLGGKAFLNPGDMIALDSLTRSSQERVNLPKINSTLERVRQTVEHVRRLPHERLKR